MFKIGDWVINIKTKNTATVIAVFPASGNCLRDLYLIDDGDEQNYIIVDADNIIEYNKYFFDE